MKKFEPKVILPVRPFITGLHSALDIYGASGIRMYERIQEHWTTVVLQPWPTPEESIRESVAAVNSEYQRLLAEHRD